MQNGTPKSTAAEMDQLATYLGALRRLAPLSREAEHALAVRARAGDARARRELIQHNLPFVVAIARRQRRGSVRLEDVIQEGNLGLIRAAEKFDPEAGTRFCTYAAWWIRAYIGKYLKEARSAVRPRSGTVAQPDRSLEAPAGDDGLAHLDRLEHPGPAPDVQCMASQRRAQVRGALARVRRRVGELGWDIIHSRLQQDAPETLEDIGRRWGVSRERVRQVEVATRQFLHRSLARVDGELAQIDEGRDAA